MEGRLSVRRVGGGGAGGAETVQEELVAGQLEAGGNGWGGAGQGAAWQVVDAAAVPAMKVVVVAFAGDFIARRLAGDLDGREPAIGDERVDVAIDGGHADILHDALGRGKCFVWREGTCGELKGGPDGIFLAGFSKSKGHRVRVLPGLDES